MSDNNILFIFPGQGSQYPGMGSDLCRDFPAAQAIYREADEILGYDLSKLAFEGPEEQLTLTRHTQPALLTHQLACLTVFKELTGGRVTPHVTAGHSLGEYTALVAAGVLSFADALQLVQERGNLMGTHGEGEMLAMPLTRKAAEPLAVKHGCAVAGCNLPEQTVVGGSAADLEALTAEAGEVFPRKRLVRLKTEGAFHTYYMVEAARRYRAVLAQATFAATDTRVLSNFTGDYHDADEQLIRARLFFQLFHPVLWYADLSQALGDGFTTVVEFGGGIGNGASPEEKRPNLESMVKKAARLLEIEVNYIPAINSTTLRAAANAIAG